MTARERLLTVRRAVVATVVLRAGLLGVAVGLLTWLAERLLGVGASAVLVSVAAGLVAFVALLSRLGKARSLERVALWVEERHPELQYSVVALAGDSASSTMLEAQASSVDWWTSSRRRVLRALAWPVAAALGALLLVRVLAGTVDIGVQANERGSWSPLRAAVNADALAHVRATVTPPAYLGRAAESVDDPASVTALVTSVVTVSGDGDARDVVAIVDSSSRPVARRDGGWSVSLGMPGRASMLRLHHRDGHGRDRLIVLAPVVDAPPVVTLLLPARDTVMRVARGTLSLRAQLRDDIGLRDAQFEVVISSGQDEKFTFRTTSVGRARFANARDAWLDARLSLDSLALKPGDVLQLRAVARDANSATGPGVGSSETRSLRVARAGEYDSVSVDAAPPGDPEGQVLSERMLITLTEALDRRRPRMARQTMLAESQRIAADQARLRKRVGDIVFQRLGSEPLGEETGGAAVTGKLSADELLRRAEEATRGTAGGVMDVEGDETPILAINKPLLEAFNAMWDAGRSLEQGETDGALPPMRRALAAIERARQAERIYLRGRPSAVVVDVVKARLAGKDRGASSLRAMRVPSEPAARRRALSFAHVTELLSTDAAAAADALLVMRVDALESAPVLAAALDEASQAVRRGDASKIPLALQRVRRALGAAPRPGNVMSLWDGAP